MRLWTTLSTLLVLIGALGFSQITTASARGGAAHNIMSSAGYQRALKESRERYTRQYYGQSYVQAPRVYSTRKWRHRHWRHRR